VKAGGISPAVWFFALFGLLSLTVEYNISAATDQAAGFWMQRHISPSRTAVMSIWTDFGSTWFVLPATLLLGILLARAGMSYWVKRLAWTVPGCMLSVEIVKHFFQRPRPAVPHPILELATYSFPSGHTAAATALYGFLAIFICSRIGKKGLRGLVWCAAVLMIAGVAVSRAYLGVHYVTDVTAGLIMGLAWLSLGRAVCSVGL
jgi:membrane-associated phospholipid phosphatase